MRLKTSKKILKSKLKGLNTAANKITNTPLLPIHAQNIDRRPLHKDLLNKFLVLEN